MAAGVHVTRPNVLIKRAETPYKKYYETYWGIAKNRKRCRGENLCMSFIKEVSPKTTDSIYDFGCGTGRGGLALAALTGSNVVMVDITSTCLDEDVANACKNQEGKIIFLEHDLFNQLPKRLKYGYAIDFFDKLNEEDLPNILKNCLNAVDRLYFTVTLTKEKPFEWWVTYLRQCDIITYLANVVDGEGIFYTSSWLDADELVKLGQVNIENEEHLYNIRTNIKKDVLQCRPYNKQEKV